MADGLRLVMLGTGTFAEPTLEAMLAQTRHSIIGLVTQPDRAVGSVSGTTRQVGKGMKALADSAGVAVFQPESINTAEGVAQLKSWNADLLVTAAYGQILSGDVLNAARLGGINVHGSLLPRYRGAAPVAWAIWRGETEAGVTIIRMSTGLDSGDMLARVVLAIDPHETAGELEARLAPLGAHLAVETIDRLADGPVTGEQQDPALVTKAPKLKKEHGAIDWARPAAEICRQVRAMQPWPTAYTFIHRATAMPQRLIITQSIALPQTDIGLGLTTVAPDGCAIDVTAGSGTVRVVELQPAGKKRMPAAAFINGRLWRPGDRFGPD